MTLNDEYQSMAANAICHAASMAGEEWRAAGAMHGAPSAVWRPRLFIDGNQWCALFGDNLQDGVAGFGESPAAAMWDFDKAWGAKLKTPNAGVTGLASGLMDGLAVRPMKARQNDKGNDHEQGKEASEETRPPPRGLQPHDFAAEDRRRAPRSQRLP